MCHSSSRNCHFFAITKPSSFHYGFCLFVVVHYVIYCFLYLLSSSRESNNCSECFYENTLADTNKPKLKNRGKKLGQGQAMYEHVIKEQGKNHKIRKTWVQPEVENKRLSMSNVKTELNKYFAKSFC